MSPVTLPAAFATPMPPGAFAAPVPVAPARPRIDIARPPAAHLRVSAPRRVRGRAPPSARLRTPPTAGPRAPFPRLRVSTHRCSCAGAGCVLCEHGTDAHQLVVADQLGIATAVASQLGIVSHALDAELAARAAAGARCVCGGAGCALCEGVPTPGDKVNVLAHGLCVDGAGRDWCGIRD